jgi:DNA-binding response OmpR family regulator
MGHFLKHASGMRAFAIFFGLLDARLSAGQVASPGVPCMSAEAVARNSSQAGEEAHSNNATPLAMLRAEGELVRFVQPALLAAGYAIDSETQTFEALDRLQDHPPSVFLLQIGSQHSDATALCRWLRSHPVFAKAAIILLATQLDETDRVVGLEAGADVYLAMPFAARELIAQIRAVLRSYQRRTEREYLSVDEIEIDVAAMTVKVSGRPVTLSITEFRLLEFLCHNPGRAVSRDQLVQIISRNPQAGRRAVDVYVRRLRQKIESDPSQPRYLKTVRGVGYRLSADRRAR